MQQVDTSLYTYWTLAQQHAKRNPTALPALKLLALKDTREGKAASRYLERLAA